MKIALGTAQLGMPYGLARRQPSPEEAERILDAAWALGIRCVDTAPAYGTAEAIVGRFRRRRDVEICTKLDGVDVAASVERSRSALGVDTIDHLLIHAEDQLDDALVDALLDIQRRGWVRHVGISLYDRMEVPEALTVVQVPYSVFDRRYAERFQDRVRFVRSALLQGMLVAEPPANRFVERFAAICAEHGVDRLTAALGFAASLPPDYLLVGAESVEQLSAIANARPLDPELRAALEKLEVPRTISDPRRWT